MAYSVVGEKQGRMLVLLLVGQIAGAFVVTTTILLLLAGALGAVWLLLILFSVALVDRERILTRWT